MKIVILIALTVVFVTLPWWNPCKMSLGDKITWWAVFGLGTGYVWLRSFLLFRKRR